MARTPHVTLLHVCVIVGLFLPGTAAWADEGDRTDRAPEAQLEPYANGVWLELGMGAPTGYTGLTYLHRVGLASFGAFTGYGESGLQVGTTLRGNLWSLEEGAIERILILDLSYALGIEMNGNEHNFREGLWHWIHVGIGAEIAEIGADR